MSHFIWRCISRVVLRHSKRTRVDAVAAIETARLQSRHHDAVIRNLDRVRRTNQCARRFLAMHTHGRHRRGCLGAIDVVDKDHRIAFVCGALAARGDTGTAADAALRIDEHRLFHPLPSFHLTRRRAFSLPAHNRQLPGMNLLDPRRARFELRNLRQSDRAPDSSVDSLPVVHPSDTE